MMEISRVEDLPNELLLIVFSYLTKFQLFQAFLQINRRLNNLLSEFIHHINISSILPQYEVEQYAKDILPRMKNSIYSLTFDNYHVGKEFLKHAECVQLNNLSRIKLIDQGLELQDDLLKIFQPDRLDLVVTSFDQTRRVCQLLTTSVKRLRIELPAAADANHYLNNQFKLLSPSIVVDLRVAFCKLSDYFQLFREELPLRLEKLCVSIFSIDLIQCPHPPVLPHLLDFQLESCAIPFDVLQFLLPSSNHLKRFAFIGRTTSVDAKSWKQLLIQYRSLEQLDLHLSNEQHIALYDTLEWKCAFDQYPLECHSFDRLERLHVNECVEDLHHIDYAKRISHLILRSQYWCSHFDLSLPTRTQLSQRFHHIKRLSTTVHQLEYLLANNSFHFDRLEQLDLEFAEKYCYISDALADRLPNVKSICFSSMYDGVHELPLHTLVKQILLRQFSQVTYLSIEAVRIVDDEHVEESISQWYIPPSNQPSVSYIEEKSLSIWF